MKRMTNKKIDDEYKKMMYRRFRLTVWHFRSDNKCFTLNVYVHVYVHTLVTIWSYLKKINPVHNRLDLYSSENSKLTGSVLKLCLLI